ncbi:MAG: glycogen/starch synthase [Rhodopseudomonas palustris]|nr:glycogen/starch synthase [Rhodopseudomonas palustris]
MVKTGGLADVAGALPARAAPHRGMTCARCSPAIRRCSQALRARPSRSHQFAGAARRGRRALLRGARRASSTCCVLDAPHLYDRPGNPYIGRRRQGLARQRRSASRAGRGSAAELGQRARCPAVRPSMVHAHDWQAGLAPAYLRYSGRPAARPRVFTVHNLAFQGQFPHDRCSRARAAAARLHHGRRRILRRRSAS